MMFGHGSGTSAPEQTTILAFCERSSRRLTSRLKPCPTTHAVAPEIMRLRQKNIARSLFSLQINPSASAPGAKKPGEIRYNGTFAPARLSSKA
ncbi:hypothetical protein [Paraburkholderia diazotrophica]|uniref:hypothetical protein n=1 Tax=Paraburkholderia diazotrophica TaxID=667676 RepID=UPI00116003D2|nr:hypothetical protein [Paraburkholderia diazotrophica]